MLFGSASKRNVLLLWILAMLPFALHIAAQPSEAGDMVDVTVVTNAYDTRTDDVKGCPPDGCTAENTRDGDLRDVSRWSCSRELVAEGGGTDGEECRIVYEFSDALAAVQTMSVAFYQGDERTRTMNVKVNGDQFTVIESGGVTSDLEAFELNAQDVLSLGLESVGLPEDDDFLSIIEVTFDVLEADAATSSFGVPTPSPTFSNRHAVPAPSSSDWGGGSSEDESSSVDDTGGSGASVDDPYGISTTAVWIGLVGAVTVANVAFICLARWGGVAKVTHCKLLLQAYFFSTLEGIALVVLVPSSKESLTIGAVLFFAFLSALSALLLRRAVFWLAVLNAFFQAIFAWVTLVVFVEQSMGNILLFGALAANEALVGFAIVCYATKESSTTIQRSSSNSTPTKVFFGDVWFGLCEALGDALFPLLWALLRSQFHPDSAWRSDIVFTLWGITSSASTALLFICSQPPLKDLGFGAKAVTVGIGLSSGINMVTSFVVLYMTEQNIEDPPTFDVVWSSVSGAAGVVTCLVMLALWFRRLNRVRGDDEVGSALELVFVAYRDLFGLFPDSEDESDSDDESGEYALQMAQSH